MIENKKTLAKLSNKTVQLLYDYEDQGINPIIILQVLQSCFQQSHYQKYREQSFRVIPEGNLIWLNNEKVSEVEIELHQKAMEKIYKTFKKYFAERALNNSPKL